MLTDAPPRNKNGPFLESDRMQAMPLPADDRLPRIARAIEKAMKEGMSGDVRRTCEEFIQCAGDFYRVPRCGVSVLAARPLRVREGGWASELFGDYSLQTATIRIWTRTAVRKQVTSFGTLLSTLCHEFCHHLDVQKLGFRGSPHTRGFYERTAALYHHARDTPRKRLVWARMPNGQWRIDWQRTRALNETTDRS